MDGGRKTGSCSQNRDGEGFLSLNNVGVLRVLGSSLWLNWLEEASALQSLSDTDLLRTVTIRGVHFQVHEALHRLLAHTSYHVGQIVYLAKSFRGSEWKTLSIPLGKSEQYNRNPTLEKLS